jgi:hypothetical protein
MPQSWAVGSAIAAPRVARIASQVQAWAHPKRKPRRLYWFKNDQCHTPRPSVRIEGQGPGSHLTSTLMASHSKRIVRSRGLCSNGTETWEVYAPTSAAPVP